MKFSDLEKSIKKMYKENPWLKDFVPFEPPRGYNGIYLDFDEATGDYKYPQPRGIAMTRKRYHKDREKEDENG